MPWGIAYYTRIVLTVHLLIYKFTSPCSDKQIMLTISASQTVRRIPSQISHCSSSSWTTHVLYSLLHQFCLSSLTIVKPQCPDLGICGISKENVLCTFLANSLQISLSVDIYIYIYIYIHHSYWALETSPAGTRARSRNRYGSWHTASWASSWG